MATNQSNPEQNPAEMARLAPTTPPPSHEETLKSLHGFDGDNYVNPDSNNADDSGAAPKSAGFADAGGQQNYADMTVTDLHALASEREIEGRSGMTKDDLVKALKKSDK